MPRGGARAGAGRPRLLGDDAGVLYVAMGKEEWKRLDAARRALRPRLSRAAFIRGAAIQLADAVAGGEKPAPVELGAIPSPYYPGFPSDWATSVHGAAESLGWTISTFLRTAADRLARSVSSPSPAPPAA